MSTSRASNSSDSDLMTSDEWTVVTHQEGEGLEQQTIISARRDSRESKSKEDKKKTETSPEEDQAGSEENSHSNTSSEWERVKESRQEEDVMSNGSSDIAVLGEEEEEDEQHLLSDREESKSLPPEDALGLSRVEDLRDDLSDISSIRDELNSEVDFSPSSFRHYVHVPNGKINLTLTVVAVLAVTAVLGLGIGNFIGWSCVQRVILPSLPVTQRSERDYHYSGDNKDTFSNYDLLKRVRHLHHQLEICNRHPEHKACRKESDHWRNEYMDILESEGGKQLLQEMGEKEPPNLQPTQEPSSQQQLNDLENKMSLLSRQMENLMNQKKEENPRVNRKTGAQYSPERNHKRQEHTKEDHNRKAGVNVQPPQPEKKAEPEPIPEQSRPDKDNMYSTLNEQVGQLREQNKELTIMLQMLQNNNNLNNQPSKEIDQLRDQVAQAVRENRELKAMVNGIKVNKETDVRQQINDLQMENHDLRVEIGRLRYSQSRQKVIEPTDEQDPTEEPQQDQEEQETEQTIFDKWPQVNWTELVNHLGSTGQGKKLEELGLALSQLLRDLWELNTTVFPTKEEANEEEEAREDPLKEIEQLLVSKWKELQGMVSVSKGYVSHHAEGMSRLLAGSMSKVYKAGVKALFGTPHKAAPSMDSVQPQLQKIMSKMGKVMTSLEEKWNKMKKKVGAGGSQVKMERMDDVLEEDNYDEVEDAATQWLFQRAKDREQNRELSRSKFYEDWYTLRAKNRKRQRQEQEAPFPCKDPKKCKKGNRKYAEKPMDSGNNNEDDRDLPKHTFKESRGY